MTLTLHKQTKIKINMSRFIECILYIYRLEKPLHGHGRTFYDEISYTILEITNCDIQEYDNSRCAMQALIKNAYLYATENDYSQADINILKDIIDLL